MSDQNPDIETEEELAEVADLAALDTKPSSEEGSWMQLKHPVTEALLFSDKAKSKPIRLLLLGRDSAKYRNKSREAQNRRLEKIKPGAKKISIKAEEIENDGLAIVISCTKGWENITIDGEEKEFNQNNLIEFYTRFPAFFEQADNFIGNRGNFLKAQASS